jgi:hypothetical protein
VTATASARATGSLWRGALGDLQASTTPTRLRMTVALICFAAAAFGVITATAAHTRLKAAESATELTEPLVVKAIDLHTALSDADATATSTFVTGGEEPRAQRMRYLRDLERASGALTSLARADGSTETRAAVAAVARDLPRYSGLLETARANNRQGFPVGAAYLRAASAVMREQLLPAAAVLYAAEARDLNDALRAASSLRERLVVAAAGVVLLVLLLAVQLYIARLTHRVFNVPLVVASVIVVLATAWTVFAFAREGSTTVRAQRTGSDPTEVLSAVRVLALRAQADEGLALAARGSGDADLADFDAAMRQLGVRPGSGGLLGEAHRLARHTGAGSGVDALARRFERYQSLHSRVVGLERDGRFGAAARLAVGAQGAELAAADGIGAALDALVAPRQQRFEQSADDAVAAVRGLWLALPVVAGVCALLAFLGIRRRMEEYR